MNEMRLRNQKVDVKGRSLILNVLCIIFNITGVFLVVRGYHESAENNILLLKILGFALILLSFVGLIMLKGMFLFSYLARALVGGLFIVSGLIKANDPWGFAFKLEEYFSPTGLTADFAFFGWFEPYVLPLAIIICIAEIVLGAALILGGKIKLASWALLFMMIFFTWLTYYTASCNTNQIEALASGASFERDCVTDCGCFGDALKGSVGRSLTPLESFWKDLVLFYFVLIIFINQRKIKINSVQENWVMVPSGLIVVAFFCWVFSWWFPLFFTLIALLGSFVIGNINIGKLVKDWKMALYVMLLAFIFSIYTSHYLPWKDYRPYKIGNNIVDQMSNGIPRESTWQFLYTNLETGNDEWFDQGDWEIYGDTSRYKYANDRKEHVIIEGKDPSITDFGASINFDDLSETDKSIPYVDSIITYEYDNYYMEYMTVTYREYDQVDTIWAIDYDTLIYPDSLYSASEPFIALSDPESPWVIDVTQMILSADNIFLMTIRDIENINESSIEDFKAVAAGAKEKGIPFFVISPASSEQIETFKSKYDFSPTFLMFDGTEVKIIVRSNPGLVLLQKATIADKWPSRSIPDFDSIFEDYIDRK